LKIVPQRELNEKVKLTAPIISQTPITNNGRAVCGSAPSWLPDVDLWPGLRW